MLVLSVLRYLTMERATWGILVLKGPLIWAFQRWPWKDWVFTICQDHWFLLAWWDPACLPEAALMFPVYSDHAAIQAVNHHGAMWHAQHRCRWAFFQSLSPLGLSFSLGLILLVLHLLLTGPLIVSTSLTLSTGRQVSLLAVCWTARAGSLLLLFQQVVVVTRCRFIRCHCWNVMCFSWVT